MNRLFPERARKLKRTVPQTEFFVGIDSDGTVFNSMELKHKECFIPVTIKYWGFEPISRYVREVIEYVNLYSQWRGINRWPAILRIIEYLSTHPQVMKAGFELPDFMLVKRFVDSDFPKNTKGLLRYLADCPDAGMIKWLEWSQQLDFEMKSKIAEVQPFCQAMMCLEEMHQVADLYVFTGSREEIVFREWEEHGIFSLVRGAAGQETGTKCQAIRWAFKGKYNRKKALMIGDTLGDLEAAEANGISFYPIFPGREVESWKHFQNDISALFIQSRYKGAKERSLVEEFKDYFMNDPPWTAAC